METLQLNLIKKWFDLTFQGFKKEEYRDISPFWANRLLSMENGDNLSKCYSKGAIELLCISLRCWEDLEYNSFEEVLDIFHVKFKEFKKTEFRNGYKPLNVLPRFIIENKGVTIGMGKEEWGFEGETPKFIVIHGKIIETFNTFNLKYYGKSY